MSGPAPITQIIPRPRLVRLGGREFLASEFRLADLADLQAWLEAESSDPFEDSASTILGGIRDREWKKLLWRIVDESGAWPPRLGSPDADGLIDSPSGMARQLYLSLRREHPEIDQAEADRLLAEVTPAEWSRFSRWAWAVKPEAVIRSLIDGPREDPGRPTDWTALWCSYVAKVGPGGPPFESLTLTQLRSWLADGDPSEAEESGGTDLTSQHTAMAKATKRREFWAEIADEMT